jgi:5,10-methylenetetrahydromethanopterin reductase
MAGHFAMGIARGVGIRSDVLGLEKITNAHLRDFADPMRKLWRGERVSYEGPLGKFPSLHMTNWINDDIPLMFVGFGEKSLAFARCVPANPRSRAFCWPQQSPRLIRRRPLPALP